MVPVNARTRANAEVGILHVCRLIKMDVPDDVALGRSVRVYCPFGETAHKDGGEEPAFRIYPDSNSAWCFAEQVYFSPVRLYALSIGVDETEAARQLLESIGRAAITQDLSQLEVSLPDPEPDLHSLADALKIYCARETARSGAEWELLQLDGPVAERLAQCFNLLSRVRTSEDAVQWLAATKQAMGELLR